MKRRAFGITSIMILGLALLALLRQSPSFQAGASNRAAVVPATTTPWLRGARAIGVVPVSQRMTLTVTLQPRDPAGLRQFTQAVATPGSPLFRHVLTTAQFMQTYGPTDATRKVVLAYLRASGLTIAQIQDGGLTLRVQGTAGQIATALRVTFRTYHATNGTTFFANDRDITLPANVAPAIAGIVGLDDATRFHPQIAPPTRHHPIATPHATCPSSGSGYFSMPQLASIYHFPQNASATSAHLALLELDGYQASDITAFAACYASGVNVANVVRPRLVDTSTPLPAAPARMKTNWISRSRLASRPRSGKLTYTKRRIAVRAGSTSSRRWPVTTRMAR